MLSTIPVSQSDRLFGHGWPYAEAPEDSDAKKYFAIIKLTTQIYSWAAAFRRDAFSPAIRFAHKLTKKQTRLQALQQLTGFVSLLAAIRLVRQGWRHACAPEDSARAGLPRVGGSVAETQTPFA